MKKKSLLIIVVALICNLHLVISNCHSQTITIAPNLNSPWSLVTDNSYVYWVEGGYNYGALKKVSINGGAITTLATGLVDPVGIGIDGDYVYWIEWNTDFNGLIKRIQKTGGSITTIASGLHCAQNFMAFNNNNVYFANKQADGKGAIMYAPKDGSGSLTTLVGGFSNLTLAIAIDNNLVYFYDDNNNIKTIPANGGTITTIGNGNPYMFYIHGSDLYWTEFSYGNIKKMPKTGGTVTTIATGSDMPANLVVINNNVYWIEADEYGKVKKAPVNGGTTTVISNESNTIGIATDGTSLYWAESVIEHGGKIQKLDIITGIGLPKNNNTDFTVIPKSDGNSYLLSFNATTVSTYKLTVYSSLGTPIYSMAFENKEGSFSKEIKLENIESGIYFFNLQSAEGFATKKMLLVK